jgi:hypothetical protein
VVLVGALVLIWVVSPTERKRRDLVERLEPGDSTSRVEELLGSAGTRCPVGSLAHLERSFPPGWPGASTQTAIQALARRTTERWVYPLSSRHRSECSPVDGVTELGVGGDGRIVWYVAITGKTTLILPDDLTPAGPEGSTGP